MSTPAPTTLHPFETGKRLSTRDSSLIALERLYRRRAMLEELIQMLERYTEHETARRLRYVTPRQ